MMSTKRLMLWLAALALAGAGAGMVGACPTDEALLRLCRCEDSFNGVLLDCGGSGRAGAEVLRALAGSRAQLGIVQQLSLANGSLSVLPDDALRGLYIKKLDLSRCGLRNVSRRALAGLENVLQSLILQDNELTEIPEAIRKSNLLSLVQLDLSGNEIGDLTGEEQPLTNLPRLTDLSLARNRICQIRKDVFGAVKGSLQTLNLGANCLGAVPAAAIRGFRKLLALHLHNNNITQLEPLQFMNLPELSLLNLARNRIKLIHQKAFLNVPNLRFLYISDNNLTQLEAHQFRVFDRLEMLDLTRNQLKTLPELAFAESARLTQLYLGDNEISALAPNAFANSSLVILLLANNKLTSLTPDIFSGLSSLQQLSLKNNQISFIAPTTFYQLPSLVILDLADNQLSNIQPATFLAQLNLFLLDLSGNKLHNVPYNAFNQHIVSVLFKENPLVCTEKVHVVQNGVGLHLPDVADAICRDLRASQSIPAERTQIMATNSSTASEETVGNDATRRSIIKPLKTVTVDTNHLLPVKFNQETVNVAAATTMKPGDTLNTEQKTELPESSAKFINQAATFPPNPRKLVPGQHNAFQRVVGVSEINEEPVNESLPAENRVLTPWQANRPPYRQTTNASPNDLASHFPEERAEDFTLPPGVILAPARSSSQRPRPGLDANTDLARISFYKPSPPPGTKTLVPKKPAVWPDAATAADQVPERTTNRGHSSASTAMVVCLSVVTVVLAGVLATLCAVRRRRRLGASPFGLGGGSSSAASRTSAYVTAQAAQLHYATLGPVAAYPASASWAHYQRDGSHAARPHFYK